MLVTISVQRTRVVHTAMSHGKETREYKSVRKNWRTINDHLRVNEGARRSLAAEYKENAWIDITYDPEVSEFTGLALNRIENDASQYRIFMGMLRNTEGMIDIIVSRIEGTYSSGAGLQNTNNNEISPVYGCIIHPFRV